MSIVRPSFSDLGLFCPMSGGGAISPSILLLLFSVQRVAACRDMATVEFVVRLLLEPVVSSMGIFLLGRRQWLLPFPVDPGADHDFSTT